MVLLLLLLQRRHTAHNTQHTFVRPFGRPRRASPATRGDRRRAGWNFSFLFFLGFAFAGRDSRATTGCDPVSRRAKCHIGPCKKRLARAETTVSFRTDRAVKRARLPATSSLRGNDGDVKVADAPTTAVLALGCHYVVAGRSVGDTTRLDDGCASTTARFVVSTVTDLPHSIGVGSDVSHLSISNGCDLDRFFVL